MQKMSENWLTNITAPSRSLDARVDVFRDSTLVYSFLPNDYLSSFKIERTADSGKIFGYTICQKATIEILDIAATPFSLQKDDEIKVYIGTGAELAKNPIFYVDEVTRDEVKKKITIVAYDLINKTGKHTWSELNITYPCTDFDIANEIGNFLGVTTSRMYVVETKEIEYTSDTIPNLEGTELLRDVINNLAEAMGMVVYMDYNNNLRFRKIAANKSVLNITKDDYFEFKLGGNGRITEIISVNDLEDVAAFVGTKDGRSHIMRSNPFVENRDDIQAILQDILDTDRDDVFYAYSLKWRGNPCLDIGDRVNIEKEDGTTVDVFYFGETLAYNGGLTATCEWKLPDEETVETPPPTIGQAINQTYAKVNKVDKKIELVASDVEDTNTKVGELEVTTDNISASVSQNADSISSLSLTAGDITASVQQVEQLIQDGLESVNGEISTLSQRVDLGVTAEDVQIAITSELANGVDKVTTSTGFTFNEDGLTVSKSTSDITTTITEDGMTVDRGGETVLTANNEGVQAEDLHATTFLIVGLNSRFEDYQGNRTGCFFIG